MMRPKLKKKKKEKLTPEERKISQASLTNLKNWRTENKNNSYFWINSEIFRKLLHLRNKKRMLWKRGNQKTTACSWRLKLWLEFKFQLKSPWPVWLSWWEHWPMHQKVADSIPGQGTCLGVASVPTGVLYRSQLIHVSLLNQCFSPSLSPSLPYSLKKSISMSSGKDKK